MSTQHLSHFSFYFMRNKASENLFQIFQSMGSLQAKHWSGLSCPPPGVRGGCSRGRTCLKGQLLSAKFGFLWTHMSIHRATHHGSQCYDPGQFLFSFPPNYVSKGPKPLKNRESIFFCPSTFPTATSQPFRGQHRLIPEATPFSWSWV